MGNPSIREDHEANAYAIIAVLEFLIIILYLIIIYLFIYFILFIFFALGTQSPIPFILFI